MRDAVFYTSLELEEVNKALNRMLRSSELWVSPAKKMVPRNIRMLCDWMNGDSIANLVSEHGICRESVRRILERELRRLRKFIEQAARNEGGGE